MSLLASPRHFRSLVIVPFWRLYSLFPRAAQTGSTSTPAENATILYALVKENGLENTQVVPTGVTPGGEFKVARGQANPWGFYEPDLALLLLFPYYNGPELTIDGRRATRGGDDQALRLRLGCSDQRPLSPVGRTCLKLIKGDIRARLVPILDEDQISPTSTALDFPKMEKTTIAASEPSTPAN